MSSSDPCANNYWLTILVEIRHDNRDRDWGSLGTCPSQGFDCVTGLEVLKTRGEIA